MASVEIIYSLGNERKKVKFVQSKLGSLTKQATISHQRLGLSMQPYTY